MKAAFKLHDGLDLDDLIPAFAAITEPGIRDDRGRSVEFPSCIVLVFDKGFNSHTRHNALTQKELNWVTRIRGNALYRVIERRETRPGRGITSEQTIEHTGTKAQKAKLPPIRRIGCREPETNKHCAFMTNRFDWSARTIADIYYIGRSNCSLYG